MKPLTIRPPTHQKVTRILFLFKKSLLLSLQFRLPSCRFHIQYSLFDDDGFCAIRDVYTFRLRADTQIHSNHYSRNYLLHNYHRGTRFGPKFYSPTFWNLDNYQDILITKFVLFRKRIFSIDQQRISY